jgi:hypothetical protein
MSGILFMAIATILVAMFVLFIIGILADIEWMVYLFGRGIFIATLSVALGGVIIYGWILVLA